MQLSLWCHSALWQVYEAVVLPDDGINLGDGNTTTKTQRVDALGRPFTMKHLTKLVSSILDSIHVWIVQTFANAGFASAVCTYQGLLTRYTMQVQ